MLLLLFLASIALISASFLYSPSAVFNAKSNLSKKLTKWKKYKPTIGFIAIGLGITLVGLFILHIIQEIKWLIVLVISLASFGLGIVFSAESISSLFNNKNVDKLIQIGKDIDESLKRSFSSKFVAIFLFVLGFIGIISALAFNFA